MASITDQPSRHASMAEAFRRHYEEDVSDWGKSSGAGSHPYWAMEYRAFLEKFILMNRITSVVDIGCGDWSFSRFVNFGGTSYQGFDLVSSVVERNRSRFATEMVSFDLMPQDWTQVPGGDVLLIKDVLQHLPNDDIMTFYRSIFPKYRMCLITNSFRKLNTASNTDIVSGDFRCLDLSLPPYSFSGAYVLEFHSPLWENIRTFLHVPSSS